MRSILKLCLSEGRSLAAFVNIRLGSKYLGSDKRKLTNQKCNLRQKKFCKIGPSTTTAIILQIVFVTNIFAAFNDAPLSDQFSPSIERLLSYTSSCIPWMLSKTVWSTEYRLTFFCFVLNHRMYSEKVILAAHLNLSLSCTFVCRGQNKINRMN